MSDFIFRGGFGELCASTRIRLARNLKGYSYRGLTPQDKADIADKVMAALATAPAISAQFIRQTVPPNDPNGIILVERRLISPAFARTGGELIRTKDGGVSMMIGEEDHIRIQVLGSGLCPRECLETAQRLATLLEANIPMDYTEKLGYLTACPSNLGTGLRVSVMLHLPILTANGSIHRLMNRAGQQGLTVRGAYGEGSRASGGFYQLSNQITLGLSESAITDRVIEAATNTIALEKRAREELRAADEAQLADQICRAVGTLQTARLITGKEALDCLSLALIGVQLGYVHGITSSELIAAEQDTRPALLPGTPAERDFSRAKLLRQLTQKITLSE